MKRNIVKKLVISVCAVCLSIVCPLCTAFAAQDNETSAPVYAESLQNGVYPIDVTSSASMFKVVACKLTVSGSDMTAEMTLSGKGYEKLFSGTGEQAAAAGEEAYYFFHETDEGKYAYTFPVPALNQPVECAAYSSKKQRWYDRTLVFEAASLPEEAFRKAEQKAEEPLRVMVIADIVLAAGASAAIVISAMVLSARQKRRRNG